MPAGKRLRIRCPDCEADLLVDASSGEILEHRAARKPLAGGATLESLMEEHDDGRSRAEAIFEQEKAALADRGRLLEEKFEQALSRAEDSDESPAPRPFDLD